MGQFTIFLVEDDPLYSEFLYYHLTLNPDFQVESFSNGTDCLNNLYKNPDIITIDYNLPDMSGRELFEKLIASGQGGAVIIISGQKDINTAIELLKDGAYDYIVKDENTADRLWHSVILLRQNLFLREENNRLRKEVERKYDFSNVILGSSGRVKETFSLMEKAAGSNITVSITGETGTGKELVAKAIHYHSNRKNNPFVAVNMGAIPKELIESELFGYEKGAFTGASERKSGLFEEADTGTIFLDEIADMELHMQTRLLRVLQEREVRRLGGKKDIKIDVRVITATNKDLSDEVKKGLFRSDLFYRIMGFPIHLAPLRERGNDIILLSKHFADTFRQENQKTKAVFTEAAVKKLLSYPWPGNIRELKTTIELATILCDDDKIDAAHINFRPVSSAEIMKTDEMTLNDRILEYVRECLIRYNFNPTIAAKKLGISRATVYRYIKDLNL
ncbi:MAG: sigma-54-dependent Fis family transcriptional regulator [Bacteroidales bacterium]|nr:sigma-54-dependent Fis family transcriptional regulator [Bacteroidales bacterium]